MRCKSATEIAKFVSIYYVFTIIAIIDRERICGS